MRPLNVSALGDAESGAAAAYGAGLRGGVAQLLGVHVEFVLVSGATGGATGATLAFYDSDALNTANNSVALDDAVDALAGVSPSGAPAPTSAGEAPGGRRLGGSGGTRRARGARGGGAPRALEVLLQPIQPPSLLRPSEAGVSFTVLIPNGIAAASAALAHLKALDAAAYGVLNATLLAATAALPNPPTGFALAVPRHRWLWSRLRVDAGRFSWTFCAPARRRRWAAAQRSCVLRAPCSACACSGCAARRRLAQTRGSPWRRARPTPPRRCGGG